MNTTINYLLHAADTNLILSQRNSEWCGHGPVLEQDIAITNISLDLLGQARNFYQYAAILVGNNTTEDQLAYFRDERAFKNLLLVELPKGDWAQTILRQYFFSQFQYLLYQQLSLHANTQIAAIAVKSLKETTYHLRWSSEWVLRLGNGTEESKNRMHQAIDNIWNYTGEMFEAADYETEMGINLQSIQVQWNEKVHTLLQEATLTVPQPCYQHTGGKTGTHTEHMGFILTELQYVQRAYPGCEW